jgi:Caspase domain
MALFKLSQVAGDNDTVLIYYGGHGVYEDATKLAFWMPSDAVVGVPPTYLAASQISEAIDRIQALKLIVISDSCFSGDLFRSDTPPIAEDGDHMKMLLAMAQDKSRVLITSGGNQPVRDTGGDGHSIFAQALLYGLEHMQPAEFTAQELFSRYILPAVTSSAQPDQKPQEPQFRTIGSVGHMAGDVIFVRSAG